MKFAQRSIMLSVFFILTACVTVNVYFPAAVAERAVDEFVKDVYGNQEADKVEEDSSSYQSPLQLPESSIALRVLDFIVPGAMAAEPDFDIKTPGTNKLKAAMGKRHQKLSAYYASGAVGMTNTGLLAVRDAKAVSLKERNVVKQLVAEENRDRNQLYKEVAVANKHPEWEKTIRDLYAKRWIANAPGGWWYQTGSGGWKQK